MASRIVPAIPASLTSDQSALSLGRCATQHRRAGSSWSAPSGAAFASAQQAVQAAVQAQREFGAESWPDSEPLRVRMGIHAGEPIRSADGYTGLDVHRAARICWDAGTLGRWDAGTLGRWDAGTLAMIQGSYQEVYDLLDDWRRIAESHSDMVTAGRCLTYRGIVETCFDEAGHLGRHTPWRTAEAASTILEHTPDTRCRALAISQLGNLYLEMHDYAAAEPLYAEALLAFRELHENWWTGRRMQYLELAAFGREQHRRAALLIGDSDAKLFGLVSARPTRGEAVESAAAFGIVQHIPGPTST